VWNKFDCFIYPIDPPPPPSHLTGALNPKKNGSTKIVAGTSFQAHANPRGKMSESGKYMYQHSMSSNAGYGLPPLHINTAAGSSTSSVYKPRVLLCAPSNTAVDELVFRLMTQVGNSFSHVIECSYLSFLNWVTGCHWDEWQAIE
jgi:superfamily I DNA and/or RNA helicase